MTLFAVLINYSMVLQFMGKIADVIMPIVMGFIMALILNVSMCGFEKLITRKKKHRLVFTLVIPTIVDSVVSLYEIIMQN